MTEKKQLDCELHCKATAEVKKSVMVDLEKPDVPMSELLKELEENEVKDNTDSDS
ncbi:MAG: hypothetical protein ACKOPU_05710 [Candidatus Planktophila sp.]